MNNRIKTAIEFLKDNYYFVVEDLQLKINSNGNLVVTGWSNYLSIQNITKENALIELNEVKIIFENILFKSKELKDFIYNKKIEYTLCYDDNGKSSIDICSEIEGVLKWHI